MNKDDFDIQPGDIVQIDPESDSCFGGCLVIVTEVKSWGIQGFARVPGEGDNGGNSYIRKKWEEFEYCGKAQWLQKNEINED